MDDDEDDGEEEMRLDEELVGEMDANADPADDESSEGGGEEEELAGMGAPLAVQLTRLRVMAAALERADTSKLTGTAALLLEAKVQELERIMEGLGLVATTEPNGTPTPLARTETPVGMFRTATPLGTLQQGSVITQRAQAAVQGIKGDAVSGNARLDEALGSAEPKVPPKRQKREGNLTL